MMMATTTNSYSYLLIGSGRVARHLGHYFNLKNISYQTWDRAQDPQALRPKILKATHTLLAISDSALDGFYRQHLAGHEKTFVHFSGARTISDMISAHPLMTFGPHLYELADYEKIHFTVCGGSLKQALPSLNNPSSSITPDQKALYHTMCVVGGNFSTLVIQKMLAEFKDLKIPVEASEAYLHQVLKNTLQSPDQALTGPLARKDFSTVEKNLAALSGDPYLEIYKSFLKLHWPTYPEK